MELKQRFDKAQLSRIMEESLIYMCACPAQVARQILDLRKLYDYQKHCIAEEADPPPERVQVHQMIAEQTAESHAGMERLLEDILRIEQWDAETLRMPEHLRQLRDRKLKE